MSAMPGLAMESSAKGVSLSTTTALLTETLSAAEGAPRMMRMFSAVATTGDVAVMANPNRAALKSVL